MKYVGSLLVVLLFALSLGGAAGVQEASAVEFIVVASGSPGGVYFPLGAGMANIITRDVDGVMAQSESTGASVENVRYVGRHESEMGMAMANVAYDAYAGQGDFEGDQQDILTLFSMYPAQQHLIVDASSDIYSVADLAGKRVSVDAPGSGCEVTSYIILEAAGIRDEVTTLNYSQPEAAEALKDGNVDAVFYNFASPGSVVEEIMFTRDIRFVPMDDELLDAVIADYPYFTAGVIPAGHYELEEDVSALTVGNLMVVHRDMDEEMAYNIVASVFSEVGLSELVGIHPIGRVMNTTVAALSPLPLHPGAARFFEEQ